MLLILRNVFWTILMPGAVTIYFPYLILGGIILPHSWGFLQWLAIPIAVIGIIVLLYCIATFAFKGHGTLSPLDPPRKLVVVGLYRYVRNPMYCGVLSILLAEASFFESTSLLLYTGVWLLLVNLMIIFFEEPTLRSQFGDSYNEYCNVVNRWLPGKPYKNAT